MENNSLSSTQRLRKQRYALRTWLRRNSGVERVAGCGMGAIDGNVTITMGTNSNGTRSAGSKGLILCNSVWQCPVCAAKVSSRRSNEMLQAFDTWRAKGGDVLFVTFTLRHSARQALSLVWDGLSAAWRGLVSGKGWQNLREEWGLVGFVRAVEVTHGSNGWHVHAHTALFIEPGISYADSDVSELENILFSRWDSALKTAGFSAVRGVGVDVRRAFDGSGLANYLNKQSNDFTKGLANEVTMGSNKKAGKGSRSAFTILAQLKFDDQTTCTCNGVRGVSDRCNLCLWREWEVATHGRRQLTWSRNLSAILAAEPVDETADTDLTDYVEIVVIKSMAWRDLDAHNQVHNAYTIFENDGVLAGMRFLDELGIAWHLPLLSNIPEHYLHPLMKEDTLNV